MQSDPKANKIPVLSCDFIIKSSQSNKYIFVFERHLLFYICNDTDILSLLTNCLGSDHKFQFQKKEVMKFIYVQKQKKCYTAITWNCGPRPQLHST